jgi:hypothetical protein
VVQIEFWLPVFLATVKIYEIRLYAASVGHWLMICQEFWVNCFRLTCSDEDNITVGRWWNQWVHMAARHCYLQWSWWSDTSCEQFFLSLRRLSLLSRFPCIFIYIYIYR